MTEQCQNAAYYVKCIIPFFVLSAIALRTTVPGKGARRKGERPHADAPTRPVRAQNRISGAEMPQARYAASCDGEGQTNAASNPITRLVFLGVRRGLVGGGRVEIAWGLTQRRGARIVRGISAAAPGPARAAAQTERPSALARLADLAAERCAAAVRFAPRVLLWLVLGLCALIGLSASAEAQVITSVTVSPTTFTAAGQPLTFSINFSTTRVLKALSFAANSTTCQTTPSSVPPWPLLFRFRSPTRSPAWRPM